MPNSMTLGSGDAVVLRKQYRGLSHDPYNAPPMDSGPHRAQPRWLRPRELAVEEPADHDMRLRGWHPGVGPATRKIAPRYR